MKTILIGAAIGATMLGAMAIPALAANTTIVVRPQNMQGWTFFDDNGHGGSGTLVFGPGTPPLGVGSAELGLTASNQGYMLGYVGYAGTKLSDITSLSYSTYVQQVNNTVAPALQLNIDPDLTDSHTGWFGRLVYEPYYTHNVVDGGWQTWNTQDNAVNGAVGNWWFSNGTLASLTGCTQAKPCTWSEVVSALPNAGINTIYPGVGFKAGSNWAVPFVGNIDAFTIGVSGNNTIYDFEPSCTTVTTSKGTMTAAAVDPVSPFTGTIDASGCQIGVYFDQSGSVNGAAISGASYYGVFVDGIHSGATTVDVTNSTVSKIGDTPFDGVQRGNAIYYDGDGTLGTVSGTVSGNTIFAYQKGGIVVNGSNATVDVLDNAVTGLGKVNFIAQNGIQFGYGSNGIARGNLIANNFYTGTVGVGPNPGGQNPPGWQYISTGLLLYEPGQVFHSENHYSGNQHNEAMVP